MKRNCLKIISAVALGLLVVGVPLRAQTEHAVEAQEVSKEEAAKKYPPGPKGYLAGVALSTSTGGFFRSPYSTKSYDCRKQKHGAFVQDKYAKPPQLFTVP
jgi:hypothetical protein